MKMSNAELLGFFAANGALKQRPMPAKLAWKLQANDRILRPFAEAFDTATESLRKRYAEKDAEGAPKMIKSDQGESSYDISPDNLAAANKELAELMKESFEVQPIELALADFPSTFELTPELMGLLAPLIDGDTSDTKGRK